MSEKATASKKEGGIEKGSRYLRNFNLAVGIGALAVGTAIGNSLVVAYGAFNMAQAGFFEMTRRWGKKRKTAPKMGRLALRPT